MHTKSTTEPHDGSVARTRVARVAAVAFATSVLLIPGLAAAEEGGGGGGGGGMGGPTSLVFTLTWKTNDGVVHDSMPAPGDAGFGAVSFNAGGKEMGTATCTQAIGAAVLVCDYQNQGHGSLPGLVLPMSPKATFTVSVTTVPTGWTVDPTTIGTFSGGEACPRGEGGHEGEEGGHEGGEGGHEGGEGGHETTTTLEGAAPAAEEGGGGGEGGKEPHFCYHNVVLIQDPAEQVTPVPDAVVQSEVVAAAPVVATPAVTG
jgi:hypothetical protein